MRVTTEEFSVPSLACFGGPNEPKMGSKEGPHALSAQRQICASTNSQCSLIWLEIFARLLLRQRRYFFISLGKHDSCMRRSSPMCMEPPIIWQVKNTLELRPLLRTRAWRLLIHLLTTVQPVALSGMILSRMACLTDPSQIANMYENFRPPGPVHPQPRVLGSLFDAIGSIRLEKSIYPVLLFHAPPRIWGSGKRLSTTVESRLLSS